MLPFLRSKPAWQPLPNHDEENDAFLEDDFGNSLLIRKQKNGRWPARMATAFIIVALFFAISSFFDSSTKPPVKVENSSGGSPHPTAPPAIPPPSAEAAQKTSSSPVGTEDVCGTFDAPFDIYSCKIKTSRKVFIDWVRSQSETLEEAKAAFSKRYNRPVPKWFDKWYHFVQQHDVIVRDDYDQLHEDMKPFRALSPALIKERLRDVSREEQAEVGVGVVSHLKIKNHEAYIQHHEKAMPEIAHMMLDPIKHLIPDLEILWSWGDNPLSIAPSPRPDAIHRNHNWTYQREEGPAFLSAPCPVSTWKDSISAKRLKYKPMHDICSPGALDMFKERHGRFQTFGWAYNVTLPMLSTAKMSTNQDILCPHREYPLPHHVDQIPWESKSTTMYWRGSNSGQINTKFNIRTSHRSRFVLNSQEWSRTIAKIDAKQVGEKSAADQIKAMLADGRAHQHDLDREGLEALARLPSNVFNVSFTNIGYCSDPSCETLAAISPATPKLPFTAVHEHKFVFDVDGYGLSARFYNLLKSNSLVFKQTEWREYHDEHLMPWVHYVPVSMSMSELPMLLDYFINDEHGQKNAKLIAEAGRSWATKALRPIDQSTYLLRVLLEWADIYNA